MSGTDTAIRVLEWATFGSGPPPSGDLAEVAELLRPGPGLREAMGRLAAKSSARLGWGSPPLGDPTEPGLGSALMASALGAAQGHPEDAALVLEAVPRARRPGELALRHGLVAEAVRHLPQRPPEVESEPRSESEAEPGGTADGEESSTPKAPVLFREDWLTLSPITALLGAPAEIQQGELTGLAAELAGQSAGRRWLATVLAEPVDEPAVRAWRRELIGRLRRQGGDGTELVLDIYEANGIHFAERSLEQVRWARAVLFERFAAEEDADLAEALSIAAWWRPLWEIRRDRPEALRRRFYLGYDYLEGLDLCRLAEQLTGRGL